MDLIRLLFAFIASVVLLAQPPNSLQVRIVDGDGGFNDIKNRIGHVITVEILDMSKNPVAGAQVTLTAPAVGPGGTFANGTRSEVLITDEAGQVHSAGLTPNDKEGRFFISVVARSQGREGTRRIGQSNTTAAVIIKN